MALGMKLREQGLLLEEEDDTAGFLGVTWKGMLMGSLS